MEIIRIALLLFLFLCMDVDSKQLWCHQGGAKKDWGPIQCPETTKECFKFVCSGGQGKKF